MAPNVTAHFFAANDINGDVIHEISDEDSFFRGLTLHLDRDGLGSSDLLLSRTINFAGFASGTFQPEVFVRFLVPAYSDTLYYPWALSLEKRQQVVVHRNEKGAETFRFAGAGPKSLLSRHALGIRSHMAGEWNVDLTNGVWRWTENATIGQILNRILNEDQARPDPSLPFMETSFNASTDSQSVAWADANVAEDGLFEIPIGTDYLTILRDLDDVVELSSSIDLGEVGDPQFVLNVWQGLGEDRMGSSFGSGVCLLKEGENIANDSLTVEGQNLRKASHVIVEGKDGHWVVAERPGFSPGDYVKYAKIEYTRSSSDYWLEKAGLRWLKRQDIGEREYTVEIVPGTSDAAGRYFPAPDRVLWLSNEVSLDSSADGSSHSELDVDPSDPQVLTGIDLELGPAGDDTDAEAVAKSWNVKAILNRERPGIATKSPSQASAASGDSCRCRPTLPAPEQEDPTPGTIVVEWDFESHGFGSDLLDTTGTYGSGLVYQPAGSGNNPTATAGGWTNASHRATASIPISPDTDYIFETDIRWFFTPTVRKVYLKYDGAGGGTGPNPGDEVLADGSAGYAEDTNYSISHPFTTPPGVSSLRIWFAPFSGMNVDNMRISTVPTPAENDPDAVDYGECPHHSRSFLPSDYVLCRLDTLAASIPAALDDLEDVDAGTPSDGDVLTWDATAEEWVPDTPAGGGGAPTTADYLVGTAQGGLSAEIVVGTTPGGELGGTWSSPTVDATHSGSAHHAEDHHTRHEASGADKIKLDDLEPPDDNTDLNASTSKHGLLKKLPNDATKYLDGSGNFTDPGLAGGSTGNVIATPSGSVVTIPGLGLADRKPASAGTYDEEWDGTADTLPANWAWSGSAPSGSDEWKLNSRWPSLLTVEGTGNANYNLARSSFSPGSGAFGLWCKAHIGPFAAADKVTFRMYIYNSALTEGRGANFRASGSHAPAVRHLKTISSAESVWYTEHALGKFINTLYLGITRDGSNNWTAWVSQDGLAWDRQDNAAQAHSFTVDKILLGFGTANGSQSFLAIDWLRYRTDQLFPRP